MGKYFLQEIQNNLGRFIDSAKPKGGIFFYTRVCVEMKLEKGLLEEIKVEMEGWSGVQLLDYEHVSFKCNMSHDYGHFAKNSPKAQELLSALYKTQEEQGASQ